MERGAAYMIAAVHVDVTGSKEFPDGGAILKCDGVEQLLSRSEIGLLAPFANIDRLEASSHALTARIIFNESDVSSVYERDTMQRHSRDSTANIVLVFLFLQRLFFVIPWLRTVFAQILNALSHCPKERKDRKSTRLNSSHSGESRMPSSA